MNNKKAGRLPGAELFQPIVSLYSFVKCVDIQCRTHSGYLKIAQRLGRLNTMNLSFQLAWLSNVIQEKIELTGKIKLSKRWHN